MQSFLIFYPPCVLGLSVDLHSDQPRSDDDDAVDDAKLALRAWMKEIIPVADGIS